MIRQAENPDPHPPLLAAPATLGHAATVVVADCGLPDLRILS